jgi:hypothetical protein
MLGEGSLVSEPDRQLQGATPRLRPGATGHASGHRL